MSPTPRRAQFAQGTAPIGRRKPAFPKEPAKLKPALMPRRCAYCRATFIPERAQDKNQRFCCPNHRKNYFRYGGLPFDKMKQAIFKELRKEIKKLFAENWNQAISAAKQAKLPPVDKWAYLRKGATK